MQKELQQWIALLKIVTQKNINPYMEVPLVDASEE
jgi:hypothetical protein